MNTKRTNQNPQTLATLRTQRRAKRFYAMLSGVALAAAFTVVPALAAETGGAAGGDALTAVNNLSTFIFSLIRAIGLILLGYGPVLPVPRSLPALQRHPDHRGRNHHRFYEGDSQPHHGLRCAAVHGGRGSALPHGSYREVMLHGNRFVDSG